MDIMRIMDKLNRYLPQVSTLIEIKTIPVLSVDNGIRLIFEKDMHGLTGRQNISKQLSFKLLNLLSLIPSHSTSKPSIFLTLETLSFSPFESSR